MSKTNPTQKPRRRRRRGPKPAPRLRINPMFVGAIRESRQTISSLAAIAGFRCVTRLSPMLYRRRVVATALTLDRLRLVADAVDFPREHILLDQDEPTSIGAAVAR